MATKKKMLQAAAGSATGGAALDITDVFSTYLYEGNGGTQVIENGINLGQSNSGGSVDFSGADTVRMNVPSSSDFGYGTGDYTIEFFVYKFFDKNYITYFDQRTSSQNATTASPFLYTDSGGTLYFYLTGANRITGSGTNVATGAWTHVALCRASSQTRLFVNGTQIGSTYSDSTNYETPASNWSVGGSLEQNLYNVEGHMSNVRVVKGSALYTSNFTTPTAALTAVSGTVLLALQGDEPFTDNSSSGHSLSNNGALTSKFGPFDAAEAGEGGLVWLKGRNNGNSHYLHDSERTITKWLQSQTTAAEQTNGPVTSFNSNGFSLGFGQGNGGANSSGDTFASWTFRKAPKFFTCVQFSGTGPGSAVNEQQVSHDLGAKPGIVIIKRTDATGDWWVFTDVIDGSNDYGYLNQQTAFGNSGNNVATDSVFSVGGVLNTSGATYTAYLFANNNGDGEFGPGGNQDIIKCGSYTGNGSTDGPEVDLGFEPQWLLIKNTGTTSQWRMMDNMRGLPVGGTDISLEANASNSETTDTNTANVDIKPNGFKITTTRGDWNNNGNTIIYMAIRRGPLAEPESATDVFAIDTRNSTGEGVEPGFRSGFGAVDFALQKYVTVTDDWRAVSRLTQGNQLQTQSTAVETTLSYAMFDYSNGWSAADGTNSNLYSWMWKRAPGYFDVVTYNGNSTSGHTVSHNLGVVPDMMWVKCRTKDENWVVYHEGLGSPPDENYIYLDNNRVKNSDGNTIRLWNHTSPTDSEFTLGDEGRVNLSAHTYIAYLFASLPGISKVGSFTATGSALDIDCGFTSGARFVLIKRTDSTGDWFVFDSVRGITDSTSPYLYINSTSSESVASYIDPLASGFTVTTDFFGSGDFIFYAIA